MNVHRVKQLFFPTVPLHTTDSRNGVPPSMLDKCLTQNTAAGSHIECWAMEPQITHGENLWEALDVLRDAGQHGAKTCLGMGSFLSERATVEDSYGKV